MAADAPYLQSHEQKWQQCQLAKTIQIFNNRATTLKINFLLLICDEEEMIDETIMNHKKL
ncbi:conserved hypothetical protein [Ricinus communis]|uniref:Uncharacterized protein n=1 Tax=Ricinus communis TaxID=3988 RepID=B9SLH1_RICCO|nr:conserved hypothetical protein [Ricinus communis]